MGLFILFAPFLVGFALCISDGDADLPQHLLVDLTDRCSQQPEKSLGKYGRMRKTYLKEHRPILYNQMLLSEKLYPHLLDIGHGIVHLVCSFLGWLRALHFGR